MKLLQQALSEAWKYQYLTYPNPAVGALISTEKGSVISVQAHKGAGLPHAEVEVIKDAYFKLTNDKDILKLTKSDEIHLYILKKHNNIFKNLSMYVTLEPCNHYGKTPPCSKLIKGLGFKRVIIGIKDPNKEAAGGYEYLKKSGIKVDILNSKECKELIEPFLKWSQSRFVFFKLAMSLNGVIDGGRITSGKSFERVHKFRDKIDLLVIGGDTVRIDRPTLDARLVGGKAPDVLIYTKKDDIDRQIPLFLVPNRKVFVSDNFEILKDYRFIMIEGGEGMLNATKEIVDFYTIFSAPYFKEGKHPNINLKFKELFSMKSGIDRLSWYKKLT